MHNSQSIRVRTYIDETDIGQVAVGQAVVLEIQALDGAEYQGRVARRAAQGESSQGLVTFAVDIEFEAPDLRLLGGLTADVTIIVGESLDALVVPRSAVVESPRGAIVQVLEADGSIARRQVQTGLSDELYTEIVEGVAEGERVVTESMAAGAGQAPPEGFQPPGGLIPGAGAFMRPSR